MTDGFSEPEETLRIYPLRIVGPARSDIEDAYAHFVRTAGEPAADAWQDGLYAAIATLATTPRRQVAPESQRFGQEVRQLLYRRRPGSPAYRVLFTLVEEEGELPFVRIVHVRHAARRPMTRAEAQERLRAIQEEQ